MNIKDFKVGQDAWIFMKGGHINKTTVTKIGRKYVYTAEFMSFDNFFYPYMECTCEIGGETVDVAVDYVEVIVLNREGELVNEVKVSPKEVLGKIDDFTLHFTNNTVYLQTSVMVYECPKEDFVEGKVNFKEAYPVDIERENREAKVQ